MKALVFLYENLWKAAQLSLVVLCGVVLMAVPNALNSQAANNVDSNSKLILQTPEQASVSQGNIFSIVNSLQGGVYAFAVTDHYAYLGQGTGLLVLDLQNLAQPVAVARVHLPGIVTWVAVDPTQPYVYVGSREHGFQIIDVTDPLNPILRGRFSI